MNHGFHETHSIQILKSLKSVDETVALNNIGVFSLRDLSEFTPCRYAEILVGALNNNNIRELVLSEYLSVSVDEEALVSIDEFETSALQGVNDEILEVLVDVFELKTIADVARFDAFLEAKKYVEWESAKIFCEKPSAPNELLPGMTGSTHSQFRFSNYVKEQEWLFNETSLSYYSSLDEPQPENAMINAFYRAQYKFHLGYLAEIKQKWVNAGTHLGEIVHSLALAPGESRNIAFVEWYSRQRSSRVEDTEVSEELTSEFFQNRALNEVVVTTAQEHLFGMTEIDATTSTSGFGLTGGYGKTSGIGGSASADLTSLVGLPLGVSGAATNSSAGSLGASYVTSKGTTQGVLQSETTGERTVTGNVIQNIADSTLQNSSNIRSLMSTVVVEDQQEGGQSAQTRNVTNYNHCHALTVQYYEVLQKYLTSTRANTLVPVLYLPFRPIDFNIDVIKKYWVILQEGASFKLPKPKVSKFDGFIKDYKPTNGVFDSSGDVRITAVTIASSHTFSEGVRARLYDASPEVTLNISGNDMDEALDFTMSGSSTYIDYEFLEDLSLTKTEFGTVDSFQIDENVKSRISSKFKSELKSKMKSYLGDSSKTPKVSDLNREDNELGHGNNRDNLKQMVDDGKYSLLNGGETISFTLDLEYTLEDSAGNTVIVSQTYTDSLSYSTLHGGYDEEVFNVTDHINSQLEDVSDINALDHLEEVEAHFDTFKYFYTKYLLSNTEKEQVIDVIEHLGFSQSSRLTPLTELIDPNPLGIVENLLIFKLRRGDDGESRSLGKLFNFKGTLKRKGSEESQAVHGTALRMEVYRNGQPHYEYSLQTNRVPPLSGLATQDPNYKLTMVAPKGEGQQTLTGGLNATQVIRDVVHSDRYDLTGVITQSDNGLQAEYGLPGYSGDNNDIPSFDLDVELYDPVIPSGQDTPIGTIDNYFDDIGQYEKVIGKKVRKSDVYLPTRGVFAEAILGRANSAEYINVHRFYNWQDSPIPNLAPAIGTVDVNENQANEISDSINPNVPVSVLNQISPQPMPATSLGDALTAVQNGSMFTDMSKTDSLVATMSDLASLANNTAQLAGNLSGEAAANALNSATEIGRQVASMVNKTLDSNTAPAPLTQTEKGACANCLDDIGSDGKVTPTEKAKARGMGTPIPEEPDPEPYVPDPVSFQPPVFELATDGDLAYASTTGLGTFLTTLLPEEIDPTGIAEYLGELAEPVLNRFQYGGNFSFNGRIKLTEGDDSSNRSFHMYGNTLALEGTSVSGLVTDWTVIQLLEEINDLAEMNAARVEIALVAGDLSEIIALLTETESTIDGLITTVNDWKDMTDTSSLPEPIKTWVEDSTLYQHLQSFLDYCLKTLSAINEFKTVLQNDLQAAGLFMKIEGFTDWVFIPYLNRTIGTSFITTIGTSNKAQMDLRAE